MSIKVHMTSYASHEFDTKQQKQRQNILPFLRDIRIPLYFLWGSNSPHALGVSVRNNSYKKNALHVMRAYDYRGARVSHEFDPKQQKQKTKTLACSRRSDIGAKRKERRGEKRRGEWGERNEGKRRAFFRSRPNRLAFFSLAVLSAAPHYPNAWNRLQRHRQGNKDIGTEAVIVCLIKFHYITFSIVIIRHTTTEWAISWKNSKSTTLMI